MHLRLERLERRSFMSATPALYAAGGGAYLTEFDPTTGAVLATITPPAGTGTGGITALAADQGGDVYVADASSGDILKVDATTHAASVFLTPAAFGMSEIPQMAVAGDGTLAIVAGNIQEFSPAGNLIANVAAGDYVGAGPDGLFYVFQTGISSLGFHTFVGQRYVPAVTSRSAPSSRRAWTTPPATTRRRRSTSERTATCT